MALKATIFKANISICDMDRNYYDTLNLTIARHPSETDKRMMVRILAFIIHAHEQLQFTKGLSSDEEPEIWQIDYSEQIQLWIELGQIDEKRIKKGCNRSEKVAIYTYGSSVENWWNKIKSKASSYKNLDVYQVSENTTDQLCDLVSRTMELQCTIDTGQIWLSNQSDSVHIEMNTLQQFD